MRLLFTLLFFSAFVQAQHYFSLQSGNVIWERHFSTPEKNVMEQLRKTQKLHFLKPASHTVVALFFGLQVLERFRVATCNYRKYNEHNQAEDNRQKEVQKHRSQHTDDYASEGLLGIYVAIKPY